MIIAPLLLLASVASASPAQRATLVQVTTTEDEVDPNDGKISLREAMDQVNLSDAEGNILLQGGKEYRLTKCGTTDDDANRNGDLDHLSQGLLTISGNGATIRQTCPGARVIDQFGAAQLNLNDLTITGGDAATEPGGGVFIRGLGGVNVKNSNIYGNKSAGAGGGIASQGDVVLTGSSVSLNFARELGAGIASFTSATLVNSNVSGNTVGEQSRIGIGGVAAEHAVTLIYSTVQDNSAPNVDVRSGALSAFGSVIAVPRGAGKSCGALKEPTVSWGYNFAGDASCGFGRNPTDKGNGGDPKLRPQPPERGIVPLVHPLADSPLIDAIPIAACVPKGLKAGVLPPWANLQADMRGVARPQGKGCDIGAVEVASAQPQTPSHAGGGHAVVAPRRKPTHHRKRK